MSNKSEVLVLFSGGIDSTACLYYFINNNYKVNGLFINYNQAAVEEEKYATSTICKYFNINLTVINCAGFKRWGEGEILGRNAFLLSTALMAAKDNENLVAVGLHAGALYNDCTIFFVKKMQELFDLYTDGRISIAAPFIDWSKGDIWQYCLNNSIPVDLTYSCENGLKQPCGKCSSCKDLEVLYAGKK